MEVVVALGGFFLGGCVLIAAYFLYKAINIANDEALEHSKIEEQKRQFNLKFALDLEKAQMEGAKLQFLDEDKHADVIETLKHKDNSDDVNNSVSEDMEEYYK